MSEMQVLGGNWQFENDKRLFQGTLHYNAENRFIALHLLIPAEDKACPCAPYTGRIPSITGKLFTGTNVVLFDCITGKEETVVFSHASQVIYAKYAFWGLRVNSVDELVFKQVSVDFGDILDWFELCRYTMNEPFSGWGVEWEHDAPIVFKCNENLTIELEPRCGGALGSCAKKYELKQSVIVSFQYEIDVAWNQVLEDIQIIRYLISLGTTQRIEIETAKYQHRFLYEEISGAESRKIYPNGDVLFGTGKVGHPSKKYPFEYLFKLKELTEINGLANWYTNFEKLQPVLDLYNVAYTNNATVISLFLNLTQALETLHARFYANTWGKYKTRALQRLSSFDETNPYRAYWETLLMGDKPENKRILLKFRLSDLCFDLWDDFSSVGLKIDAFIDGVADTRNYYTHYDDNKKEKCFDKNYMPTASSILMTLIEYHVMLIIGFNQTKARDKAGKAIADIMMSHRMQTEMTKVY